MTTEIGHLSYELPDLEGALHTYYSKGIFKRTGDITFSGITLFPAADEGNVYKCIGHGKLGGQHGLQVQNGDLLLCIRNSTGGTSEKALSDFVLIRNNTFLILYNYEKGTDYSAIKDSDSVNIAIGKLENMMDVHFKKAASNTLGHFMTNENYQVDSDGVVTLHGKINLPGHPTASDPMDNDPKGMVTVGFLNEYLKKYDVEYGVRRQISSSNSFFERIVKTGITVLYGSDTGLISYTSTASTAGENSFDNIYPWNKMRRCTMDTNGRITSYQGDPTYTEDGSIGNVMVEIPKFYTKYQYNPNGDGYEYWWVCGSKVDDSYQLNDLFRNTWEYVDYGEIEATYISAFPIVIEGTSPQVIKSKAGVTPKVFTTVDDFKAAIALLPSRHSFGTLRTLDLIMTLMIVEFCTTNTQLLYNGIGTSHTTGIVQGVKGSSGSINDPLNIEAFVYRGIESIWGNGGQALHDIYAVNNAGTLKLYTSTLNSLYDFSTFPVTQAIADEYYLDLIADTIPRNQAAYATTLLYNKEYPFCKIPIGTGSSTTFLCDIQDYTENGIFVSGASVGSMTERGLFNLTTSDRPNSSSFGARLQYCLRSMKA